jgi:hypothetical protein
VEVVASLPPQPANPAPARPTAASATANRRPRGARALRSVRGELAVTGFRRGPAGEGRSTGSR